MRVLRHDNMSFLRLSGAQVTPQPRLSKGKVERPFQYFSTQWLASRSQVTVTQDESGTLACDVVVADAEGSKCPATSTVSSPASATPGAGVKHGRRGDRGARGALGG